MSDQLSPFVTFGIEDVVGVDRVTGEVLFYLNYVSDADGDFSADVAKLETGSYNFPVHVVPKSFKSSFKISCQEYNRDLITISTGGVKTDYTASASGMVIEMENIVGTDAYSATGFIDVSPLAGGSANMKQGYYRAYATTTGTLDIYKVGKLDLNRGIDVTADANCKVTSASLTIPVSPGGTLDVPSLGITLTRGGSALSVTQGDSFEFHVLPPFTSSWSVKFGQNDATFPAIKLVVTSKPTPLGEVMVLVFPRVLCIGHPFKLSRDSHASIDLQIEPMQDATRDYIAKVFSVVRS